ncbi:MAG: ATP-dependent nuclease, partial [Sphaerochaetaceae bacterium]
KDGLNELVSVFVSFLNTEKRLEAANPPKSIDLLNTPVQHPIHFMQIDDRIESKISHYFQQAFGEDLIVHRNAGDNVPLYVGKKPELLHGEDRVSFAYTSRLSQLDKLHEQGDGMRSFVGVMLYAFISFYSVLLIDEPEAFLHPPQAKQLGRMIANDIPKGRQIFISTHSEEFIQGIIDSKKSNVKIIRINRIENINHISVLNSEEIYKIWNDSLLRHSNVLSGLFHKKVVICESDSDCRFFSAMLTRRYEERGEQPPNILFIHCGGKHRIPVAVQALVNLNVDIRVIVDFDVLQDMVPLKDIFTLLGGDWQSIEPKWRLVKTQIENKRPALLTTELKSDILKIFDATTDRVMPTNQIKEISRLLRNASAWEEAKKNGKSFVPSGNPSMAFEEMQTELKTHNLFILELGELECFVKVVGNHGPKWVSEVLEDFELSSPIFDAAKRFIDEVIG